LLAMLAAALTLKITVLAPAGTVTEAGTVSAVLLLARVTAAPPTGAAWVRVMLQVLTELWPRLEGVQARPDTRTCVTRFMVAVCELLPRVAVTVAL